MMTKHDRSHWLSMATLGLSLALGTGCKVAAPVETQTGAVGAAGNGVAAAAAGSPASAGAKPAAAGTGATMTATSGAAGAKASSSASGGEAGTSSATDPQTASAAGSSAQSASAAGSAGTTPAAKPKNPNAIPACEGKNNEGACDGAKLYYCIDEAPDGASMSCMSAAMCQVGIKSAKCGVCEPGKFKCMEAELQKCDENGQWKLEATCDSAALCKETKGICDKSVCTDGEYKCSGDDLQVCKKDLTDFMTEKTCEKGLCNAEAKKCNECDPMVPKTCDSMSQLTMCDADGMKKTDSCPASKKYCIADKKDCFECVTAMDCGMPKSECGTMACKDNKCVEGDPKPLKTKCSSGVCDLTGNCVVCITDDDCHDAQKACLTGVGCVSKIPLTAINDIFQGYLVTVAAGYNATIPGGSPDHITGNNSSDTTQTVGYPPYSSLGCLSLLAGPTLILNYGVYDTTNNANPCDKSLTVTAERK